MSKQKKNMTFGCFHASNSSLCIQEPKWVNILHTLSQAECYQHHERQWQCQNGMCHVYLKINKKTRFKHKCFCGNPNQLCAPYKLIKHIWGINYSVSSVPVE